MNRPDIELKKERDFSDVFNASFAFISQEIGRLAKVIALYAGVPVIIAVVMSAYYTPDAVNFVFQVMEGDISDAGPDMSLVMLTTIIGLLAQLFIAGLVPAYLGKYEEKGKSGFTAGDVWQHFFKHLGVIIGYTMLSFLLLMVGAMLLFIPAIYLLVPLSFVLYVKVIENRDLSSTFSRCFQLIRNNWWRTFGILILAYIIIAIISWLFTVPAMIVGAIEGFLVGSGQQAAFNSNSLAVILSSIFGGLGQYILYPVLYIIIGFQYYTLREEKDRDTLMGKVSAINEEE